MKKKISMLFGVLFILLSCMLLGGCSIEVSETEKQNKNKYVYYYLNSDETELLEAEYYPSEETDEFMVKDLMQRMGNKAKEGEEITLLPKEVSINSYDLLNGLLVIDFNGQYSKMSRAREVLVRAGIVKNFIQIPGIQLIRFTVNGNPLLDSRNEEVGDMSLSTFLEFSENSNDYRYDTFTLYFTDKTGQHLVTEQRTVYYKRNLPKVRVVLEQLAKGPMVKGNYPTIPANSQTLGVTIADRVCYVDMNHSFQDYALDIPENIMVYSIVNSLLAVCDADKVQISIEGNTSGKLKEELPLYSFYEKNESLVLVNSELLETES